MPAYGGRSSPHSPTSLWSSLGTSPGAGRSPDVPVDFGLADYASCLAKLIAALALGPAHAARISWGGTVVQELYRHRPEWWRRSLTPTPAGRGRYLSRRCAGAYQALAAPAEEFDPARAIPDWFAGDPPADFVPLLRELAAAVRPREPQASVIRDG
jgi:pimeloyl-ACP methyl ester carboxylesterase